MRIISITFEGPLRPWRTSDERRGERLAPAEPAGEGEDADRGSVGAHEAGHGLQDLGAREDFQAYAYA